MDNIIIIKDSLGFNYALKDMHDEFIQDKKNLSYAYLQSRYGEFCLNERDIYDDLEQVYLCSDTEEKMNKGWITTDPIIHFKYEHHALQ